MLIYIRDNKILGLKHYADMKDSLLSDLLIQDNIKNENQFMAFSDSSWQDFPDTGISTRAYIIFYQGGPIYYGTHVPVLVAQSSVEIEYNSASTAGKTLVHFSMLSHELLNKDPDIVT